VDDGGRVRGDEGADGAEVRRWLQGGLTVAEGEEEEPVERANGAAENDGGRVPAQPKRWHEEAEKTYTHTPQHSVSHGVIPPATQASCIN
jgi:hypothetical protein